MTKQLSLGIAEQSYCVGICLFCSKPLTTELFCNEDHKERYQRLTQPREYRRKVGATLYEQRERETGRAFGVGERNTVQPRRTAKCPLSRNTNGRKAVSKGKRKRK